MSIFKQLICDTDHVTPLYRCSTSTTVKDGSHDYLILSKVHANLALLPLKHYFYQSFSARDQVSFCNLWISLTLASRFIL